MEDSDIGNLIHADGVVHLVDMECGKAYPLISELDVMGIEALIRDIAKDSCLARFREEEAKAERAWC